MPQQLTYPIRLPDEPAVYRGDPFDWTLAIAAGEDSDGELLDPVDLTGYGSAWAATARAGQEEVAFAVDSSHAAQGYVVLLLTAAQTAQLQERPYDFDVQATGGARSPFTVWAGSFTVVGDITAP